MALSGDSPTPFRVQIPKASPVRRNVRLDATLITWFSTFAARGVPLAAARGRLAARNSRPQHAQNPQTGVIGHASVSSGRLPHQRFIVAGEVTRGQKRTNAGGRPVNSLKGDRVRAIPLFAQAVPVAPAAADAVDHCPIRLGPHLSQSSVPAGGSPGHQLQPEHAPRPP